MPELTPRMAAIQDAAGFLGIDPNGMKAAIDIYEGHLQRAAVPENELRDALWSLLMDKGTDTVAQVDCAFEVLKPYLKGVKWNS